MKKILITAGPTNEYIDEVMKITNMSTGRLGIELTKRFLEEGSIVTLIATRSVIRSGLYERYNLNANENLKNIPIETTEDILSIKPYLDMYEKDFSDLTCPNFFMWRNYYPREYCFIDDTLIIKECSASDENDFRFYMPVGKNPEIVFAYIESYCAKKAVPLCFSNLTVDEANIISARYIKTKVCYDRCWSDYVYNAEDMRFFKGKKFAGQRNHINKFISLYGNYQYHQITRDNISDHRRWLVPFRERSPRSFPGPQRWSRY